jgi:hypothetical protein
LIRERSTRSLAAAGLMAAVAAATACGASRQGPTTDPPTPPPDEVPAAPTTDSSASPPVGSMQERLLAEDYAGVVAAYWADSTLHADQDAIFRAGVASAMPGHRAHDRRRAVALFTRLVDLYPGSDRRPIVALYLRLLEQENDLRATIDRQDRELKQLKAIDLGVQPPDEQP